MNSRYPVRNSHLSRRTPSALLRGLWAFVLAGFVLSCAGRAAAPAKPNIVFILADDMGVGDVSALNPASIWKTPHLDRLAREGMVFSDAHSSSGVCTPTRYTLMTGRYSWRGKLKRGVLNGYSPSLIEPKRQTLAGFLRTQGYATAIFGKWHLGLDFARTGPKPEDIDYAKPFGGGPLAHGFDHFFGISASLDMPPYVWLENDRVTQRPAGAVEDSPAPKLWRAGPIGGDFQMEDVQPRLIAKTVEYIAERGGRAGAAQPFFVYLPLAAPHTPTLPTAEFRGKTPTPYGDFVLQVDRDVGRIVEALERHGLAQQTLVIFTTDNGYAPAGNIPRSQNFGHDSSAGMRGTKSDAFEGGHRVPFIARWPGVTPAGSRCDAVVGHLDIFATCAELLGAKLPANVAEDSASLLNLLRGGEDAGTRRPLVNHSAEGEFAIRDGKWKLILCPGSGGWSPPSKSPSPWTQAKPDSFDGLPAFQLYDLAADPGETTNLVQREPAIVKRLGGQLRQIIERGRSTPGPDQPLEGASEWPQIAWRAQFGASAPRTP